MSLLEQLIEEYPYENWDFTSLSSNPSISFKFIINHPEYKWNKKRICKNPSITESDIRNNLEYNWDYVELCSNPNIGIHFINEFMIRPKTMVKISWANISANKSITMFDIMDYPNYKWNDRYLSMNPNISSNFILNKGNARKWFMPHVSSNPGITERDIYRQVLDFKILNLSSNPNLPAKYVNDNPSEQWNYHSVSSNSNISLNDIDTYKQIKWDSLGLSINTNININYVRSHSEINWNKQLLLSNPALTISDIENNDDYFNKDESYYRAICSNPNITKFWIQDNYKFVNFTHLSNNQIIKK